MQKNKLFGVALMLLLSCMVTPYSYGKKKTKTTTPESQTEVADSIKLIPIPKSAPVNPFVDTLFTIYGSLGAITVEQRAAIINKNIVDLEKNPFFTPDSLLVVPDEQTTNIVYLDKIIVGITDQQARIAGKEKEKLADEYREKIISAIEKEQAENYWVNIAKQIGLSLLILALTFFCIKYLNLLFRKLQKFVSNQTDKTFKAFYNLLDAGKQISLAVFLLRILKFVLIIAILYTCLLTFFRLFPETKWLSDVLLGYITTPLKKAGTAVKNYIPDLFSIIIIIVLFRLLIKGLKIVAEKIGSGSLTIRGFYKDWAMPTFNIVKIVLYIFMFIFIFPHLPNSDSKIFQGVSVFMGILFSLGSTSVISNMVSGIVITYMRPFKVGDRIKMGEFLGNVIEKTPLVTRIRTPKNEVITIPNANIMTAQTVNYTNSANEYGLILHAIVTVGYEIPWRKVHEILIEAGLNTPNVLREPKPFVLQVALDDFYVEYQINIYTKEANEMANIYSNLNKNIQDVFNREGIELLSPHYRAQRDGSTITMPKEYIKDGKDRTPPFFINGEK